VNTYRVWLRYELFRGRLTDAAFQASEANRAEVPAHLRKHSAKACSRQLVVFEVYATIRKQTEGMQPS